MLAFRSNEGAPAGGSRCVVHSKDKQLASFETKETFHSLTVSNSDASSKQEVAHDKKVCIVFRIEELYIVPKV